MKFRTLQSNQLPSEIQIHEDILSVLPSALSRKRALKVGQLKQVPMDNRDPERCVLCDPEIRPVGHSKLCTLADSHVAYFDNDFPFLPMDQKVVFLWHENETVRRKLLHCRGPGIFTRGGAKQFTHPDAG